MSKTIVEAMQLLNEILENVVQCPSDRMVVKKAVNTQSSSQLENCDICGGNHPNNECQASMKNEEQVNIIGYRTSYPFGSPMAQKHPGFQWSNPNGAKNPQRFFNQKQQQSLEDIMYKFIKATDEKVESQSSAIKNLEIQMSQLATLMFEQIKGALPSNTEKNPKENLKAISLRSGREIIDVNQGQLILRVDEERVIFEMQKMMKFPGDESSSSCFKIDLLDDLVDEYKNNQLIIDSLERCLARSGTISDDNPVIREQAEILEKESENEKVSQEEVQLKFELKELPSHLKYVFLEPELFLVIISSSLTIKQKNKLIGVLRKHKTALGWTITDIKGISPAICMHRILMENDYKPIVQPQRRLNPTMQEVVKKEVVKLLVAGIIYPISDSPWVSPIQVVPKKGGMTVIKNKNNELIPTRTVTGWKVCIDYRRLNDVTRKDHFSLPFIDQMLERVAGHGFYCFLDGYYGYNQIPIAPEDQEKSTFTCPKCCMFAIFSNMTEKFLEIFMDDFTLFERIVLGHKISAKGIEVDKAKIDLIAGLLPPTTIKGIRSFLGHADDCRKAFKILKEHLTNAPIVISPDWSEPFDIMCDSSDIAVGAILGQKRDKILGTKVTIYTDHTALKYLLAKKNARPRLLRWILLLQEFDLKIKDRKGFENQVADHLSRLENPPTEIEDIKEGFPDEHIFSVTTVINRPPWFADIANYLAGGWILKDLSYKQKKKLKKEARHYYWEDPYLFNFVQMI
ncbi:uncharacterized protein [Nicotiana sylvestris]|uniref:uncharacterized protein n=1 Tax=Nicotiana sylvestris TaxID=4096 RepID=UPI00388CC40A